MSWGGKKNNNKKQHMPTSQAAVVGTQGRCVRKHETLGTLLTACGGRPAWRALHTAPPVKKTSSRPGPIVLPQILFVVLGEQCVQEWVDAAVGVRQTCRQVIDVALGCGGQGQCRMVLTQELPDPKRQETCPKEEHNGENQVENLQGDKKEKKGIHY